jgi:prepilin-type N-terminal cleavage/methylation domain-containing protein
MKLFKNMRSRPHGKSARGFTLAEMMITVVVFLFIFTGVWIGVQIFGLRIYTLAATKLVATAGGRQALNQIRDQIREGKMVYVGTCSSANNSSFQFITNTQPQQGNALIIYPTTNATCCSIFYLDTSTTTNRLIQFNATNNAGTWTTTYTNTLTKYITNQIVFDARDWQNNIVTNYQSLDNRLLIEVTMQFSQWEYPIATVGGGVNAYDYYQLRTRVFRRAWN